MIAAEKDLWDIILQLLLVDVDRTKITPVRVAYSLLFVAHSLCYLIKF